MGQASTGFSRIPAGKDAGPEDGRFLLVLAIVLAALAAASTVFFLISLVD
jgi:hypothetical protein